MLQLDPATRAAVFARVVEAIEEYIHGVASAPVTPEMAPEEIRAGLRRCTFESPVEPLAAVDVVVKNLWRFQTHTPHPRYFGLFNPAPALMGIAGDALAAAFNPQIAAWAHSPFAAEVEAHVVRAFSARLGYNPDTADGVFCSGGAEANHTAILTALTEHFPEVGERGLRGLAASPVCYVSTEGHHSILKAVRLCGLGSEALRAVPVGEDLRLDPGALAERIAADRGKGFEPFLVVATAGTTNAGVIDPLEPLGEIARAERMWYHVDAAWGGAAVLSPRLRGLLAAVETADSITFDAHKWLSAPMGAGIYLTRHPGVLTRTFSTPTAYMPRDAQGLDVIDPHLHSMQWSRRFIGLKVFLALLVAGWDGYAAMVDRMTTMGDMLRRLLKEDGWEIVNATPLPVVCFADARLSDPEPVVREVVRSGDAWISTTRLRGRAVIRACITNYRTGEDDIAALVTSLRRARAACLGGGGAA